MINTKRNVELAPELPLLDVPEFIETTAKERDEARRQIEKSLLPEQKILSVETPNIVESTQNPSATKAFLRLTGVTLNSEVGQRPSVASMASEANSSVESQRLYEVVFGRDSLIVAKFTSEKYPNLMRATVMELAKHQGVRYNSASEEEPGKVIHELRDPKIDPIAIKLSAERGWGWPYYGSVDATPLFIGGIHTVVKSQGLDILSQTYTDRNGNQATIADSLERSLDWMLNKFSQNPEGLLEYKRSNPGGIENSVWKDSWDSYSHADGTIANQEKGIASIEVQVLAYDALLDAIEIYQAMGKPDENRLAALKAATENLKTQIMEKFWVEDEHGGYFAQGTDRDEQDNLRLLKVRSSNMGHVLNSRLLEGDDPEIVRKREALITTLFSDEMLATAGIRTLSSQEYRYRPGAYHNGSVWLWDTYYIALGLERHGYDTLSLDLKKRMYNVINQTHMFPEYVRGDSGPEITLNTHIIDVWDSRYNKGNRLEQPPQEIQAWTVAAMLAAKRKFQPLRLIKNTDVLTPITPLIAKKRDFEKNIMIKVAA